MKISRNVAATLGALAGLAAAALAGGNQPPVCDAGPVALVEANGPVTAVQLDGTGSYDPDQTELTLLWSHPSSDVWFDDPTSPTPIMFTAIPQGMCVFECPQIFLTVSDGDFSSTCHTAALISDTTPPDMQMPEDVLMLWAGGVAANQHDPDAMGRATAVDLLTPTTMTWSDEILHGAPPTGIEDIVFRTWTAADECGNSTSAMQTILFVGPSFFGTVALDAMPGDCMNGYAVADPGVVKVHLVGDAGFDPSGVAFRSLALRRSDGIGGFVHPLSGRIDDRTTMSPTGMCHEDGADGYDDLVLRFSKADLARTLQLYAATDRAVVAVDLFGILQDGTPFSGRDFLILRMED